MKYRQAKKNLKNEMKLYLRDLEGNPLNMRANEVVGRILRELSLLKLNKHERRRSN